MISSKINPQDVQKCENQQPNNLQVREAVMKIK
jgi:hypothetical protein